MSDATDAQLVSRVLSDRDRTAFGELYDRHAGVMYAVAVRLSGNEHDAEDRVHDAWLLAAGKLDAFRGASSLRTWLVGIVVNLCRESRRSGRSEVDLTEDVGAVEPSSLPHDIEPVDLGNAIAAMPARYREVIVLHDVEGFTHQEIATMLGIEPGTSKSQLARGRAWLRRALDKEHANEN